MDILGAVSPQRLISSAALDFDAMECHWSSILANASAAWLLTTSWTT